MAITGALALVMVTGCAREQPSRTVPARPIAAVTTMVDLALTPATSADAFRRWAANDDVARAAGDERLGMAWADDGQVQVTASEFRQAKLAGTAVTRFTYGRPRLYVPRQAGYPRWFVAEVDRNGQDTLMAFTKRAEGSRFRLSMAAAVAKGAKIPAVATGPEGYAFALTPHDQGLLIQPTLVASLQAAIAEEGTKSYSTKVMRPGPYTTGYFESAQKAARKAGKEGLLHDAGFNGTALPVFPLRTQDGGALVLYGLSRAVSTTIKTPGKGHLVLPPEAAHLLAGPLTGTELQVYENL
ncbi:MAG: hypothetical protein ABIQ26_12955, partial [Streptosporangiaceae bacterium]